MAQDFQTLRNLLYYPDNPERMFFFSSLEFPGTRLGTLWENPEYQKRSLQIASEGKMHLENNILTDDQGMLTKGSDKYEQKRLAIQKFLQHAIQTEKNNEISYFKNMIATIKEKYKNIQMPQSVITLINFFEKASSGMIINYDSYIVYINDLLQGEQNTKNSINYQTDRVDKIIQKTHEARDLLAYDLVGGADKFSQLNMGQKNIALWRANQQLKARYLKTKHVSTSNRDDASDTDKQINNIMKSIPKTVENKLAKFSERLIHYLVADKTVIENVKKKIIQQSLKDKNKLPSEQIIRREIELQAIAWSRAHLTQIMNTLKDDTKIKKLIDTATDNISDINTLYSIQIENLPTTISGIQSIEFFTKTLSNGKRSARGLYDTVKKFKEEIDKAKTLSKTQQEIKTVLFGPSKKGNNNSLQLMQYIQIIQEIYKQVLKQAKEVQENQQLLNIDIAEKASSFIDGKIEKGKKLTIDVKVENNQISFLAPKENNSDVINNVVEKLNSFKQMSQATTLQGLIRGLKVRASTQFRNLLTEKIINQADNQLENTIKSYLQSMSIDISGSTVQELIAGLQIAQKPNGELVLHFGGTRNDKNDFVTVTMSPSVKQLQSKLTTLLQPLLQHSIQQPLKILQKEKTQSVLNWQKQFVYEMQKLKNSDLYNNGHSDYKAKARIFFQAYNKHKQQLKNTYELLETSYGELRQLRNEIKQNNKINEEKEKQANKILHQLKSDLMDTIYRSDTMKTYNQYQNKIGFLGGSIGTTLQDQLNSIAMLFQQAGMGFSTDELDYLTDLIINTSYHSIIGTKYKGVIERYLSTVAAFALFDEGGAEVEMLASQLNKDLPNPSGPKILHLYKLNGVYYPGSFILQETLKGVMELGKVMTINTHGARVTINNPITEQVIPNRPWTPGDAINPYPWETVSSVAQQDIHLQLTFMAGMLQVLQNLQKAMNNISFPA